MYELGVCIALSGVAWLSYLCLRELGCGVVSAYTIAVIATVVTAVFWLLVIVFKTSTL